MGPTSLRIPVADGIVLHALEWNPQGDTPLVLLHGLADHARVWESFAARVPSRYRVLAPDLRGHGESSWSADRDYDLQASVRDVRALLERVGATPAVLVGHSLGGSVAIDVAARWPAEARGLVVVDSGRTQAGPRQRMRRLLKDGPAHFASVADYERVLEEWFPIAPREELARLAAYGVRERAEGGYRLKRDPAVAELMTDVLGDTRAGETLARVRCRTLVVRGRASAVLTAADAERMVRRDLADAELAVVPRSGHAVIVDNPDGFFAAVEPFLREILAPATRSRPTGGPAEVVR